MRIQAILYGMLSAFVLGIVLFFVGGIIVAMAVVVPVIVVLAIFFGRAKLEVKHGTRQL